MRDKSNVTILTSFYNLSYKTVTSRSGDSKNQSLLQIIIRECKNKSSEENHINKS